MDIAELDRVVTARLLADASEGITSVAVELASLYDAWVRRGDCRRRSPGCGRCLSNSAGGQGGLNAPPILRCSNGSRGWTEMGRLEYPDSMTRRTRPPDIDQFVLRAVDDMAPGAGGHLDRAVFAMRMAAAAELLARVEVMAARDNGATWQDVGDAFGTNRQAAHERFREGPEGGRSRLSRRPRAAQSKSETASG